VQRWIFWMPRANIARGKVLGALPRIPARGTPPETPAPFPFTPIFRNGPRPPGCAEGIFSKTENIPSAAQTPRALDRSGPFRRSPLRRERGQLQRRSLSVWSLHNGDISNELRMGTFLTRLDNSRGGMWSIIAPPFILWHARGDLNQDEFRTRTRQLDEQITRHLRRRILRDADNQRLLDGIGLQHDHGSVLRFLKTEGVEPTNNRAERILRPAVIARKVSHCSKNRRGAEAFAAFVSIAQTARKKAEQTVSQTFHSLFSPADPAIAR
jgi:hypothetical protein